MKHAASSSTKEIPCCDKKTLVLDKELEDMEQEEKLDKLILQNLCSDIMKEVMDLGECNNNFLIVPGSTQKKGKAKKTKPGSK
jgi:hypothetical protein